MTEQDTPLSPQSAESSAPVLEDRPDTNDRGWRGLTLETDEKVAFLGAVGVIVLVALATVLWGLPGLFLSGLALTLVIMGVLLVIAMGN